MSIPNPLWVYRIIHYENLKHILQNGLCARGHKNFDPNYINIGNNDIIKVREEYPVRIEGFGNIGEYIPFYFGRQSIMLYNILTGYNVPKHNPQDIIYLCCKVGSLVKNCSRYFFTDGQGNKDITGHFFELDNLNQLDWATINNNDFRKSEDDFDKPRRYQAEFLVHQEVPILCIEALVTYNQTKKVYIESLIKENNLSIPVKVIKKDFYFHF